MTILFLGGGLHLLLTGNAVIRIGGNRISVPKVFVKIIGGLAIIFSIYLFIHPEIAYNFSR
jgi:hypothetical protein